MKPGFFFASGLLLTITTSSAATHVLQAFEGDGFGDWKVEGDGFGLAPVTGSFDGVNSEIKGYSGDSLACSAHGGDKGTGSLTSPEFPVTGNFLAFLITGGNHQGTTAVQLLVDDKVEMEATGNNSLQFRPVVWDVSKFKGKSVRVRIVDSEQGSWGMIAADHFMLTDEAKPVFPPTTQNGRPPVELTASENVAGLSIPEGTRAQVIADFKRLQVTSPTALTFGSSGEIYISETHRFRHGVPDNRDHLYWYIDDITSRTTADRMKMYEKWQDKEKNTSLKFLTEEEDLVRVLTAPDATGVYQKQSVFAGGFNDALDGPAAGVFDYEGTVFLACIPKIYALKDTNGDGVAEKPDVIQDGFGVRVSFSGHDLNGFALGPDGRIYGTLGDRGMNLVTREGRHYEMPDEGSVFRFDPDGTHFEVVHTGLRNPKEIAFDVFGNGISVDNNCDQGDKARVVYLVDGADSGWNMGHQGLLVHHNQMGMRERPPAAWMAERMWEMPNPEQPAFLLPPVAHITSGPSGLTYHPGTGFLESEVNHFLICDYKGGAANSGIWSFQVEPSGAGMKMTDSRKFNWGAAATDVEYSWDGRMTVSDFITGWESHDDGRLYTVTADEPYLAEAAAQVPELIKQGFENRSSQELAGLLGHPDMRVRLRAELALTRKPDGLHMLTVATGSVQLLNRLHGVWGLGIIARRGSAVLPGSPNTSAADPALRKKAATVLASLLADSNIEVRSAAIKALGESGLSADGIAFEKLIADPSPRVRLFASIAAGRMKVTTAVPAIVAMLEGTTDPYLRHAGSFALSLLKSPVELAAFKTHASPKVRMAAVVALRRLKSDAVAEFLQDASPTISDEAVRAVNDLNLTGVRPQVAAMLDLPTNTPHTVMIWRRLLHSAFRSGDDSNARRVLKIALDTAVPADTRKEAFRLLGEWNTPKPVDQSTGRMAPLPARDPEVIRKVLNGSVPGLVSTSGNYLEAALTLIQKNQLDYTEIPDDVLRLVILNESFPGVARSKALELYTDRKPPGLEELLARLAVGTDDDLAIGALARLAKASPEKTLEGLAKATAGGSTHRQQEAWKLAATLQSEPVDALFAKGLRRLVELHGQSPSALELLEGAEPRTSPQVKEALAAFKADQSASKDPLAAFLPSLQGGDAKSGGQIFESHPAGQCMRCHAGGHGGGDAGPDLSGVALRGNSRYFLESMVNPGAKVSMGYGISSITLKGGKSVAGIVIADTPDHVDVDSSGKVLRVSRGDIDVMTPPVSAMPPMSAILSASDLRDLIAWLREQKEDKRKEKKRPTPEWVRP